MSVPTKRIPNELLEVPAIGVFTFAIGTLIFMIITFFACLSIVNLINYSTITTFEKWGSLIWLIIVVMIPVISIAEAGGVRGLFIDILGEFSSQRFVEVEQQDDGSLLMSYGFEMYDRKFHYFQIKTKLIAEISWQHGQASDIKGRECDDWHVAVWSHRSGGTYTLDRKKLHRKEIHLIGTYMTKQRCTELGNSLIAMLRDIGVPLESTDKEFEYVVDREDNASGLTAST